MRAALAIAGGLFALTSACSSVPDVHYLDIDAGPPSSSSGGGEGDSSTGSPPFVEYSCPDKPPPAGSGTCCGTTTLCRNCSTANQCDKCARLGCSNDTPCCARNAGNVECRAQSECK